MYIVAVAWVERDLGFGHNLEGAQGIKSERSFQGGVPYHNLTSSQIYMKNILWIQDRSLLDPSSNSGEGSSLRELVIHIQCIKMLRNRCVIILIPTEGFCSPRGDPHFFQDPPHFLFLILHYSRLLPAFPIIDLLLNLLYHRDNLPLLAEPICPSCDVCKSRPSLLAHPLRRRGKGPGDRDLVRLRGWIGAFAISRSFCALVVWDAHLHSDG